MLTERMFIHTKVFDRLWESLGCNDDDLWSCKRPYVTIRKGRSDQQKLEGSEMSKMGKDLIEAMQELLDYSKGKIDLRTTKFNISPVCDTISVEEIKETRKKLGMSQGVFAVVLGVSKKTVESWEAGRYTPDGAARRLISIIQVDPAFLEKYGIVQNIT